MTIRKDFALVPGRVVDNRRLADSVSLVRVETVKRVRRPKPGQFMMFWVPGHEEIPLSVAGYRDGILEFVVKAIGPTTSRVISLRPGSIVGVKGPLGNSLPATTGKCMLVAGGVGIAPLRYYLALARSEAPEAELVLVYGAKTSAELVLLDELTKLADAVVVATEDGSAGARGTVVDVVKGLTEEVRGLKLAVACGPEAMLRELVGSCNALRGKLVVGLERVMKCGIGVCGSCELGTSGLLVCRDGPWFRADRVARYLRTEA